MLPAQFLITTFRKGKAYPSKLPLDEENISLISNLLETISLSEEINRKELEEELYQIASQKKEPKVFQGLIKLLLDHTIFSKPPSEDIFTRRKKLFDQSVAYWKSTKNTGSLSEIRKEFFQTLEGYKNEEITILKENPEKWLFSDVSSYQMLEESPKISPEEVIHEYNLCQFQGLLFYTRSATLTIYRNSKSNLKQLIQMLKFFGLMFSIKNSDDELFVICIDGPDSVLENSRSYGLELANFFPFVLLLKGKWELGVTIQPPKRPRSFLVKLNENNIYKTKYQEKGIWIQEKIERLVERWNQKYESQYLAVCEDSLISISNNQVLIPDIKIISQNNHKLVYWIEWVRYINVAQLKKMKKIKHELPNNYFWAIKGKRTKWKEQFEWIESNLILFQNELTLQAIYQKIQSL